MKYWKSLLTNSAKQDEVGAASQRLIAGERSGLLTRIATTGSVSWCGPDEKLTGWLNWNR
jgi:hypothetical protein